MPCSFSFAKIIERRNALWMMEINVQLYVYFEKEISRIPYTQYISVRLAGEDGGDITPHPTLASVIPFTAGGNNVLREDVI